MSLASRTQLEVLGIGLEGSEGVSLALTSNFLVSLALVSSLGSLTPPLTTTTMIFVFSCIFVQQRYLHLLSWSN